MSSPVNHPNSSPRKWAIVFQRLKTRIQRVFEHPLEAELRRIEQIEKIYDEQREKRLEQDGWDREIDARLKRLKEANEEYLSRYLDPLGSKQGRLIGGVVSHWGDDENQR